MKVVLFCGGLGLRIRDYSESIPKPLVPIGARPIIWHVMKYYSHFGHRDFILCLGYRGEAIKEFFLNYDECLSNDFVFSEGGKEVLTRYNAEAKGGIPWIAFLDGKGKALANSDGPKGNIGFPSTDEEIGHFLKMLDSTKRHLTKEDLDQLQASLKAESKATAAAH